MKQILIVFYFFPVLISAQNIPLLEEGKVWNMSTYPFIETDFPLLYTGYSYELIGDTLIDDKLYKLVYFRENWYFFVLPNGEMGQGDNLDVPPKLIGCIREDTSTQKVYYINWYTEEFMQCWRTDVPVNKEILLYDFGLSIGDTMHYDFQTEFPYVLKSKEAFTFYNGDETTIYRFNQGLDWVVGIGGYNLDYGLLGPCLPTPFEAGCELSCVRVDSTNYIGEGECDSRSDLPSSIEVLDTDDDRLDINIYPIPTGGNLTISIDSGFESTFSYQIYDLRGNAICNEKKSSFRIQDEDLSSLANGVYVLKVILNDGTNAVRKFIKN